MPDHDSSRPRLNTRPWGKGFLHLDLENAYAQIQVSPLATDDEISATIARRRGEANRRARAQGDRGEDLEEILELDRISELIGNARKRKDYDEANPQNSLLTVQPSLTEQVFVRHRKAALISEWLCEELDEDTILPSPQCLKLWAPRGLSRELKDFLAAFDSTPKTRAGPPAMEPTSAAEPGSAPLSISVLDSIRNQEP